MKNLFSMLKKKKSGFRGAKRHSQKLKKKIEYVIRRHGYHDCASFVLAKAAGDVVFYFWMESPPSGLVYMATESKAILLIQVHLRKMTVF